MKTLKESSDDPRVNNFFFLLLFFFFSFVSSFLFLFCFFKILHNIAVAQHHLEGKKNSSRLLASMQRFALDEKRGRVSAFNCAVLLMQNKFFERAFEVAIRLFDSASDLPHWLAVKSGLLIAELGLLIAREVKSKCQMHGFGF